MRLLLVSAALAVLLVYPNFPAAGQAGNPAPAAQTVPARETHGATHWYRSRVWWTGEIFTAGMMVADGIVSARAASACSTCTEGVFHASGIGPGKRAAIELAGFSVLTSLHVVEWHYSRGTRLGWRIYSAVDVPATAGVAFGWDIHHDLVQYDCLRSHLVCH